MNDIFFSYKKKVIREIMPVEKHSFYNTERKIEDGGQAASWRCVEHEQLQILIVVPDSPVARLLSNNEDMWQELSLLATTYSEQITM